MTLTCFFLQNISSHTTRTKKRSPDSLLTSLFFQLSFRNHDDATRHLGSASCLACRSFQGMTNFRNIPSKLFFYQYCAATQDLRLAQLQKIVLSFLQVWIIKDNVTCVYEAHISQKNWRRNKINFFQKYFLLLQTLQQH